MRILLTNDDGIEAEGLASLERIARALSDPASSSPTGGRPQENEVWIVAPATEQSGKGRGITLTEPLRVNKLGDKRFSVTGTPTDCVVLAFDLMDAKPDLVLSGVNRGHNVGEDCSYSGTVAGALQGMALGVRSIALSQSLDRFHDDVTAHWETAETYAPAIIATLLAQDWQPGVVMNLNFPARPPEQVKEVEVTVQGFRQIGEMHPVKRTDLRGRDYYWMSFRGAKQDHAPGTDLRAMDDGKISVTPLHIDLTHKASVHDLKGVLGGVPPKAIAAE